MAQSTTAAEMQIHPLVAFPVDRRNNHCQHRLAGISAMFRHLILGIFYASIFGMLVAGFFRQKIVRNEIVNLWGTVTYCIELHKNINSSMIAMRMIKPLYLDINNEISLTKTFVIGAVAAAMVCIGADVILGPNLITNDFTVHRYARTITFFESMKSALPIHWILETVSGLILIQALKRSRNARLGRAMLYMLFGLSACVVAILFAHYTFILYQMSTHGGSISNVTYFLVSGPGYLFGEVIIGNFPTKASPLFIIATLSFGLVFFVYIFAYINVTSKRALGLTQRMLEKVSERDFNKIFHGSFLAFSISTGMMQFATF
ncbi:MAG: hypothetical protein H7Y60_12385 [Rhodospirillaceae bacterium]|nr:hypothetical protein [Rhodospirillales bacterium]